MSRKSRDKILEIVDLKNLETVAADHALGGANHLADTLANLNAKISDATLDTSTASRPPSGTAGGDLAGTYPNPDIAAGTIVDTDINAAAAIATTKLADGPEFLKRDGSVPWTGNQDAGTKKLTNLGTPTAGTDAATKAYADSIVSGLDVKASVRAATTANITLSGTQTVDGVALVADDRCLVKDQTAAKDNGIYDVKAGAWVRSSDADTDAEVTSGMFCFVEEGTASADAGFTLTTNDPITLGTTALSFTQFTGAGQITAGQGLTKTGNTLDVGAGNGVTVNADDVEVKRDTTGGANLAKAINVGANGVAVRIDDSTIGANVSDQLELKDLAVTNAKVSATAAIAESKLNLDFPTADAIHENVASEINGVTEKVTPVDDDVVLIEDSAAGFVKKKAKVSKIGGAGTESFFDAYDSAGGTTLTSAFVDIPLGTERKKTADYTHAAGSAEVTINTTATYVVMYAASSDVTTEDAPMQADFKMQLDTGAGFADVAGSTGRVYNEFAAEGEGTATRVLVLDLTATDKLKIQGRRKSGSGTIKTLAGASALTITRFAGVGPKGDTGPSGAPVGAAYVTIGNDATLTAERALTGTANQITITDNGANSTVVLSTPQNIHTDATPMFDAIILDLSTGKSRFGTATDNTDGAPLVMIADTATNAVGLDSNSKLLIKRDADTGYDICCGNTNKFAFMHLGKLSAANRFAFQYLSGSGNEFVEVGGQGKRIWRGDVSENMLVGGTSNFPGAGSGGLWLGVPTTEPSSPGIDSAGAFARDVSASAELIGMDEAGNATQLTPHNFEDFAPDPSFPCPFSYSSSNCYSGKRTSIDMTLLAKEVERLGGKKICYEFDLPVGEVRDWDADQEDKRARRQAELDVWNSFSAADQKRMPKPKLYLKKAPPVWLKSRLKTASIL